MGIDGVYKGGRPVMRLDHGYGCHYSTWCRVPPSGEQAYWTEANAKFDRPPNRGKTVTVGAAGHAPLRAVIS